MEEEIIQFLTEKSAIPGEGIQSDTLLTDMGVDSMRLLSFLLELENRFGVTISDRDIESIVTVGDVVRMVERKKGDSV